MTTKIKKLRNEVKLYEKKLKAAQIALYEAIENCQHEYIPGSFHMCSTYDGWDRSDYQEFTCAHCGNKIEEER